MSKDIEGWLSTCSAGDINYKNAVAAADYDTACKYWQKEKRTTAKNLLARRLFDLLRIGDEVIACDKRCRITGWTKSLKYVHLDNRLGAFDWKDLTYLPRVKK